MPVFSAPQGVRRRRTYWVAFIGQFVWIVLYGLTMLLLIHRVSDSIWNRCMFIYWAGLLILWFIQGWAGPKKTGLLDLFRNLGGPDDLDRPGGPYDKLHGRK